MPTAHSNPSVLPRPVGQIALHAAVGSHLPLPAVRSYVVSGARRTHQEATFTEEYYPVRYATDGTLIGDIRFALRHEPADLGILHAAFVALGSDALTDWVRAEPTGVYSRRAWFLYETLTSDFLELPPAQTGNYVDALDSTLHFTAAPINSPRHRVRYKTIREDFKEELDFLAVYDAAFAAVRNVVEMPDRRAALLVGGRLSRNKRGQFPELTDTEIAEMEEAILTSRSHSSRE